MIRYGTRPAFAHKRRSSHPTTTRSTSTWPPPSPRTVAAGARSGREDNEPARKRTAVVHSQLGRFSVHANTAVDEDDRAGLERLLRYASRPRLAQRRLSLDAAGRVRYRLQRPYYTG